jgi:hypothetical protein
MPMILNLSPPKRIVNKISFKDPTAPKAQVIRSTRFNMNMNMNAKSTGCGSCAGVH